MVFSVFKTGERKISGYVLFALSLPEKLTVESMESAENKQDGPNPKEGSRSKILKEN